MAKTYKIEAKIWYQCFKIDYKNKYIAIDNKHICTDTNKYSSSHCFGVKSLTSDQKCNSRF